jgi:spermidine synthase
MENLPVLLSNAVQNMEKTWQRHPPSAARKSSQNSMFTFLTFCAGFLCGAACLATLHISFSSADVQDSVGIHGDQKAGIFLAPTSDRKLPSQNVSTEMKSLQIDVFQLPAEFLDSTEKVNAVIENAILKMRGVEVLDKMSFHFTPSGLTSLWLLSASHASIHTWPSEGFAAIDILTCGTTDLSEVASWLRDLFVAVAPNADFRFSLTERGHRQPRHVNDLAVQMMQMQVSKSYFFHGQSNYQSISVLDVEGVDWVDGDHVHPARRLYLDGVLQLSSDDEFIYHEAFIHPAMLAHKDPKTVCILGGGDGGALMNVLRHRSVESAFLAEIDQTVIDVSKEAFPKFGRAFYDPRAHVEVADAFRWIANYSRSNASTLDILFFDLIDLNVPSHLLESLFMDERLSDFVKDIKAALSQAGAAVFQLGEKRKLAECVYAGEVGADCQGAQKQRHFVSQLKSVFKHVHEYSQFVPSFLGQWQFVVAFDDQTFLDRWGRSSHDVDADIVNRLHQHEALQFFSGSAMQQLAFEPETKLDLIQPYQQRVPRAKAVACEHLQPARPNSILPGYEIPYRVAASQQGIGLGIYTLRPVSQGEVIWRFHNESFIEVFPENWQEVVQAQPYAKEHGLDAFLEKDWVNEWVAKSGSGVRMLLELDDARFVNHGYTSKQNDQFLAVVTEPGASAAPTEYRDGKAIIALRDIGACEEILESYLSSEDYPEDGDRYKTPRWWVDVLRSRGLTNALGFPPSRSPFPAWAWLGTSANSD